MLFCCYVDKRFCEMIDEKQKPFLHNPRMGCIDEKKQPLNLLHLLKLLRKKRKVSSDEPPHFKGKLL